MIRPIFLPTLAIASLSACAGGAAAAPLRPRFSVAHLLSDSPAPASTPLTGSSEARLQKMNHGGPIPRGQLADRAVPGQTRRDGYRGAVRVYAWSEGALYRVTAGPGRVTDIALEPGESLISVAAGDTERWVIGDTTSGSGPARRSHVLLKPTEPRLRTNLVIATDRRVYHIDVESSAGAAMTGISWTYPADALLAIADRRQRADTAVAGVALDSLDFGYRIEGDRPPWRPLRAFDDGRQVFIEFPRSIAQGEAPPLFVSGEKGRTELVNYRVRGRYYIVDRLFGAAELRLGERHQQVVRIVRDGAGERRGS